MTEMSEEVVELLKNVREQALSDLQELERLQAIKSNDLADMQRQCDEFARSIEAKKSEISGLEAILNG